MRVGNAGCGSCLRIHLARTYLPRAGSYTHACVSQKLLQIPHAFRMLNHIPRVTTRDPVRS